MIQLWWGRNMLAVRGSSCVAALMGSKCLVYHHGYGASGSNEL